MSTLALLKLFIAVGVIALGSYSIYREKDIARLERKIAKYVKAFFKALVCTIRDKKQPEKAVEIAPYNNEEYNEMLESLNKSNRLENVLVA